MSSGTHTTITAERARELLDTFARGWSRAQPDVILQIFASDARFIETPFSEPLTGNEAIRKYWSEVPYHQSEITVTTGEVFLAGPWFAAEFKTVFRRRRTGEWVVARGSLFCESDGMLVTEMRMYWHRQT